MRHCMVASLTATDKISWGERMILTLLGLPDGSRINSNSTSPSIRFSMASAGMTGRTKVSNVSFWSIGPLAGVR